MTCAKICNIFNTCKFDALSPHLARLRQYCAKQNITADCTQSGLLDYTRQKHRKIIDKRPIQTVLEKTFFSLTLKFLVFFLLHRFVNFGSQQGYFDQYLLYMLQKTCIKDKDCYHTINFKRNSSHCYILSSNHNNGMINTRDTYKRYTKLKAVMTQKSLVYIQYLQFWFL